MCTKMSPSHGFFNSPICDPITYTGNICIYIAGKSSFLARNAEIYFQQNRILWPNQNSNLYENGNLFVEILCLIVITENMNFQKCNLRK